MGKEKRDLQKAIAEGESVALGHQVAGGVDREAWMFRWMISLRK